jgi:hypothetical protein
MLPPDYPFALGPTSICVKVAGRLSFGTFPFSAGQPRCDCANHARGHPILQLGDVLKRSVISVCPEMSVGSCIDQLTRYPNAITGFPDTSLENISDP